MKTKTVLIKCELPEDVNLPLKEIYFSDSRKWLRTTNAKIITPPTDEEIETDAITAGANASVKSGIIIGMKRMLQILGL